MRLLFPENPLMRKLPEPLFEAEFAPAKALGFECPLFDEDALSAGETSRALKRLADGDGKGLLYREWILKEETYKHKDILHARVCRG
jgi:hypothetical protein